MEKSFSVSRTRYTNLGGSQVAYRTFGTGTPIFFYNQFRGILNTWAPLFLDSLSSFYTVVLFDYPGTGDSGGALSPDIYEVAATGVGLMEKLGHGTYHIAGWSYGGLVAQAALFLNKNIIRKGVLIGTNPLGKNEVSFDPSFFRRALKPVNDLEDETIVFFEPSSEKSRTAAKASFERIAGRLDRTKIPSTPEKIPTLF